MTLTKEFARIAAATLLVLLAGYVLMGNQRQAQALPLGSQIVCWVFSDLNNIGAPIPYLTANECPGTPPVSEAGMLRVMKITAGGGAASSDFNIHVKKDGIDVAGSPQPGSPAGTTYIGLTPGAYTVSESDGPANFTLVMSGDCDSSGHVDVASSTLKVCTMTNTYNAPPAPTTGTLKVVKIVAGGTATSADFSIHVKQGATDVAGSPHAGSVAGTSYDLVPGAYVVSETGGPANYVAAMTGACDAGGNATVATSTTAVCTITNTFTGGGNASTTADVSLTKTVSNSVANPGAEVTFTLTALNSGPAAATGTVVTDILPAGLTYVSDDGAGAYATSTGIWTVGTLSNAVSKILHIIASVNFGTVGQVITNTATINANNPDSNSSNNTASVSVTSTAPGGGGEGSTNADLSLAKSVNNTAPNPGATVIYTLTITNSGPSAAASTTVTDVLPSSLTYVSDDGAGAYATSTGVWKIGALANGASATLHISATVNADTVGLAITNTASAASTNPDSNTANNSASSTITSTAPNTGGGGNTQTTTGGGGNGPIVGSFGGGGGSGPLMNYMGSVLGVSTSTESCDQYLTAFIKVGIKNDTDQVRRLQSVLRDYEGAKVDVNGVYDPATLSAVHAFQTKYSGDILTPWGVKKSTGFVYLQTRKKVNEIYCHFTKQFPLTRSQQAEVDAYRARVLGGGTPATPATRSTSSHTQVVPKPSATVSADEATTTQGDAEAGGAALPVTNGIISNISDFFGRLFRGR